MSEANQLYTAFQESMEWFEDVQGAGKYCVDGIPLGFLAQIYVFEKLVDYVGTQSYTGGLAVHLKKFGYDGHVKFAFGRAASSFASKRPDCSLAQVALLYDVRNLSKISSNNAIASELVKRGVPTIGILSDPAMKAFVHQGLPTINYSSFYSLSDELRSRSLYAEVKRELAGDAPMILSRFEEFLHGDTSRARGILRFLFVFFRQAVRDIIAVENLMSGFQPKYVVMGSDSHRIARMFSLMCRNHGWRSLVIQHGIPMGPSVYTPVCADHIAVWGTQSARWFVDHGTPPEKIIVTGNPRYDQLISASKPWRPPDSGSKVVYITNNFNDEMKAVVLDMVISATRGLGLPLYIKVHPNEDLEFYRTYLGDSLDSFQLERSIPMHEILRDGDIAITVNSTAGLEVLVLGGSLNVIALEGIPNTIDYGKYGAAKVSRTAEELRHNIKSELEAGEPRASNGVEELLKLYLGDRKQAATSSIVDFIMRDPTDLALSSR